MYVLEVMSGPLDGTRWRFEHEITIGRDDTVAYACISIDRYLSRSHAKIAALDGGDVLLTDLSSRNGTSVDGAPVAECEVALGYPFTCGKTMLRVINDTGDEAEASSAALLVNDALRISSPAELRARKLPTPIGFVPTMGALHEGHLALIDRASKECASVVVSIFVNPMQFAAGEDLDRYPRDLERDLALLRGRGVTIVFTPDVSDIYPVEFATSVDAGAIGSTFEGAARPTHFRGVATVVIKLLNLVAPTMVYLGQKDAQQIAVLRRAMTDLAVPTDIVVVPTLREPDGLACSSRNVYLTSEERLHAPLFPKILQQVAQHYRDHANRESAIEAGFTMMRASELAAIGRFDYLEIVDRDSYVPMHDDADKTQRNNAIVIGTLVFSRVRLLDNVLISDSTP